MSRVHLVVSGDVIGVGFRAWIYRYAKENHLFGWVKNREDRTVEIVAEGNKEELEKLITHCKHGPDVAWVEHVNIKWEKASNKFVDFEVVY